MLFLKASIIFFICSNSSSAVASVIRGFFSLDPILSDLSDIYSRKYSHLCKLKYSVFVHLYFILKQLVNQFFYSYSLYIYYKINNQCQMKTT